MAIVRWIVGTTLFLALLFLSLDNAQSVSLRFFRVAELQAPLIFVVFTAFAIGVALGLLAGALRTSKAKRELNRARRDARLGEPTTVAQSDRRPPPRGA